MSKCSTVECKCKWCGALFAVDSRHSHAKNCGSTQCRKDANNEYARRSYHMLKKNNPKAYQEMLNRKKTERLAREERKREEAKQAKQKANPRHVLPRRRNVSNHFICALILAFVGLLIGSSNCLIVVFGDAIAFVIGNSKFGLGLGITLICTFKQHGKIILRRFRFFLRRFWFVFR